jgi:hypothetical protein
MLVRCWCGIGIRINVGPESFQLLLLATRYSPKPLMVSGSSGLRHIDIFQTSEEFTYNQRFSFVDVIYMRKRSYARSYDDSGLTSPLVVPDFAQPQNPESTVKDSLKLLAVFFRPSAHRGNQKPCINQICWQL